MDYLNYASSLSAIQTNSDYASSLFQQTANTAYNNDLFADETAYDEAQSNAISTMTNRLQESGLMESQAGVAITQHIEKLTNMAEVSQKIAEGIGTAELAKSSATKAYSKLKTQFTTEADPESGVELVDVQPVTEGNAGTFANEDIENDGVRPARPEPPRPEPKPVEEPAGGEIQLSETGAEATESSAEVSGEIAGESLTSQAMNIANTAYESASAVASSVADSAIASASEMAGVDVSAMIGEASLAGAEIADSAFVAGASIAETAMASSVVLEPLALAGGAVMLGIGIADSIKAGQREKKEAKKKKKEIEEYNEESTAQYNKQTADATETYNKSVDEARDKSNSIKKSLISNTHLGIVGGHTSLRL